MCAEIVVGASAVAAADDSDVIDEELDDFMLEDFSS